MTEMKKQSLGERWGQLQPSKTLLVWSCIGSVAVALVAGFTWGGWVTGGTAESMAADAADEGRYDLASAICVEKFMAAPDAAAQLTALQDISSGYRQRQFVEAGSWAVMPGLEKAARESADLCAKSLAAIEPVAAAPAVEATAEDAGSTTQ